MREHTFLVIYEVRYNDLNFVMEERVVTLQHYAMLTFGYKFAGFGAKKTGGIDIMSGGVR